MDQDLKSEFSRIAGRFDTLLDFMRKHVPTKEEISQELDKLHSEVATKEELRMLTNFIDPYAKLAKHYFQELIILGARVSDGIVDSDSSGKAWRGI